MEYVALFGSEDMIWIFDKKMDDVNNIYVGTGPEY